MTVIRQGTTITSGVLVAPRPAYPQQPWSGEPEATVPQQTLSILGTPASGDTTPPTPTITVGASKSRISRVAGQDVTTFTFTVDEDFQAYQLRIVPGGSSPVTAGTLIESGAGGTAGAGKAVDVTDAELEAAGGVAGDSIIKVFAQDLAGNWSL